MNASPPPPPSRPPPGPDIGVLSLLQAVVELMPEGVVLLDGQGRVALTNRSMQALSAGETGERDPLGNPVTLDLRRPGGGRLLPADLPSVRAFLHEETVQAMELLARRADGRQVPVLASAAPVRGQAGERAGAAMILEDISVRKELQRLREEWASIVSHEMRQPLNTIMLTCENLLRGGLAEAERERVERVRAAALRLGRTTWELMDASLIDARRLELRIARIDLGALVYSIVHGVPGALQRTTVRTAGEGPLFIQADGGRIGQVVANLLSNAVEHGSPDAGISIEIGPAGGHAAISITNRGRGIPPEDLPRLFERLVRAHAAKEGLVEGSGLGLYIARGLVEAHGGRIWAESVPGETTTFHFTLPLGGPPAGGPP